MFHFPKMISMIIIKKFIYLFRQLTAMTQSKNSNSDEKMRALIRMELLDPMQEMKDESDRQYISALARGLELLRCFSPQNPHLGNQELSQMTGLPKATITRLTYTLMRLGYIKQVPQTAKYRLSAGVLAFGYSMLSNISLKTIADAHMAQLAEYANAAVAMATRDRLKMVYLHVVQGHANSTMRRNTGSVLPMHLSAMGRACLAAMPDAERDFLLDAIREKYAEDWTKINRDLEQAFKDYQQYGYCFSFGDWHKDVNSVATAMLHPNDGLITFNCGGPTFNLTREKLETDIAPRLLFMVNNISNNIY